MDPGVNLRRRMFTTWLPITHWSPSGTLQIWSQKPPPAWRIHKFSGLYQRYTSENFWSMPTVLHVVVTSQANLSTCNPRCPKFLILLTGFLRTWTHFIRKNTLSLRQSESIQGSLGYSGYSNYSGCPGLSKFLGQICEKSLVIPRLLFSYYRAQKRITHKTLYLIWLM